MQKVTGVESVRVSLNDGLTVLVLKAGNTVTLATLRAIIKNNGFVSKEATILARGTPAATGGFDVSGTGERLPVTAPPTADSGGLWRLISASK